MTLLNTMDKILYESQRQVNTPWLFKVVRKFDKKDYVSQVPDLDPDPPSQ